MWTEWPLFVARRKFLLSCSGTEWYCAGQRVGRWGIAFSDEIVTFSDRGVKLVAGSNPIAFRQMIHPRGCGKDTRYFLDITSIQLKCITFKDRTTFVPCSRKCCGCTVSWRHLWDPSVVARDEEWYIFLLAPICGSWHPSFDVIIQEIVSRLTPKKWTAIALIACDLCNRYLYFVLITIDRTRLAAVSFHASKSTSSTNTYSLTRIIQTQKCESSKISQIGEQFLEFPPSSYFHPSL